jgi:actin related protein 2/3 complex, subunit 1A/1B
MTTLPYVTLTWASEDALIAAGHDCQPVLYSGTASGWKAIGSLDDANGPRSSIASGVSTPRTPGGPGGGGGPPVGRLNNAAFKRFNEADSKGMSSPIPGTPSSPGGGFFGAGSVSGGELMTLHQNTITSIRPYEWGPNGNVTKVSTTGVDGKLIIWSVSAAAGLAPKLAGVHLR